MIKYSYFLISLHRVLFLFRSDVSNKKYYNYLCIFYECISALPCDYGNDIYKLLKKKLMNNAESIEEDKIIKYILSKDKKTSICDNWEELKESSATLKFNIKNCILLYETLNFDKLFDLLDLLEVYVEAVLKKDYWDKENFINVYVIPYETKWKERFFHKNRL